MSEQIREQVSAFLDGELPGSETELLLKRLTRDPELRESFGRYALIGESLRGGSRARVSQGFNARVNREIDGQQPAVADARAVLVRPPRWWRPFAGAAVAAGVAAVAVVALQQRAVAPTVQAAAAKSAEVFSYTVPRPMSDAPAVLPAARLTSYVFAHSKYSAVLGQNDMLNDLLSSGDVDDVGSTSGVPPGRAVSDAAMPAQSRDARVAP